MIVMSQDSPPNSEAIHKDEVQRVTLVGMAGNVALVIVKLFGGIYGNSQALVADGVHSMADLLTDLALLVGVRYWSQPADEDHPHGHLKIEVMITVFIGLSLCATALGLMWAAIQSIRSGQLEQPERVLVGVALFSVFLNEVMYRWTYTQGKKIKSMPLIANAHHHRSDALSSIPVLISVTICSLFSGWEFLDPVATVIVGIMILASAYEVLVPALYKLSDSGADPEFVERLREGVLSVQGVEGAHRIRTRFLGGESLAVDLDIEVDGAMSVYEGHEIAVKVRRFLMNDFEEIIDVVVHVDPVNTDIIRDSPAEG